MASVLVTGCSSGFGVEAVVALARAGHRVLATMRDPARGGVLAERLAGLPDADRERVSVARLDVTDAASIAAAVRDAEAAGGVDVVVHNAGTAEAGFFEDLADEQVRRVLETNFFGTLALTRALLPGMRARGSGRILVVTSVAAFAASPGMSAYAASKWALEGWAESLAAELAPFGIEVLLVEPGTYLTAIWDSAVVTVRDGSPYAPMAAALERKVRATVARVGRDPREVGERLAALATAPRPSFRNPVGPDSRAARVVAHVLPFRARQRLLARSFGIDRATEALARPAGGTTT